VSSESRVGERGAEFSMGNKGWIRLRLGRRAPALTMTGFFIEDNFGRALLALPRTGASGPRGHVA
jgi:hypothetical protein